MLDSHSEIIGTVRWNPRDKRATRMNHPISSASFNLKGWNLVCGTPWLIPALSQNFSPNGLVVLEIWQNMWFFTHIFGHISGTTGPTGLKFCVRADFGYPVAHTKFQPLRLKDAEDIGWFVWRAKWFSDVQASVCHSFELGVTIFFGLEKRPLQKQRDGREGHPL